MHLSRYCKIFPACEDPDAVFLFSTKNAAIAEIPKSTLKEIENGGLSKYDEKALREFGFLIDDPKREKKAILGFIDKLNKSNSSLIIRLVMNLNCNLACKYCFEGKRKGRHYMTKKTADDFIDIVKKKINGESINDIHITFYGGEPLLSKELVIYIAEKLRSVAKRKGISFGFSFITNGTLFTKETVKRLKPLGLKDAYITIDGPKDNHNGFRAYKSGMGSFDRIVRNIRDVGDITTVLTGGNFTKANYKRFPELLDYLYDNGLPPSKAAVLGFFPALAENSDIGPDFNDGCASMNEPWLFEANLFLREEILKRGYRLNNISPGPCAMEFENNVLVNWDGSIYKCPGMIGRKEFCVGDIWHGIKDYRKSHNLDNWKNEECLNCAYLPLCFGGCRYMKFVRDGNMNGVDCKKPYFDACLETLVKQDIKYGLTA